MEKRQVLDFLVERLKLNDRVLAEAIITHIIKEGYREDYDGWEQWRFIKQQTDKIWQAVKKLSENEIVPARIDAMIAAFPKPKDLKEQISPKKTGRMRLDQLREARKAKK